MKKFGNFLVFLGAIAFILISIVIVKIYIDKMHRKQIVKNINSYQECVDAGYLLNSPGWLECSIPGKTFSNPNPSADYITTYDQCVQYGFPVQQTYPPTCKAGDRSFVDPAATN